MKAFEIFRKDSAKKIGEGVEWYDGSVSTRCDAQEGDAYDPASFHTSMIQCAAHFERCQCTIVPGESGIPGAAERFAQLYAANRRGEKTKLRDELVGSLPAMSACDLELAVQIRILLQILDEGVPRP